MKKINALILIMIMAICAVLIWHIAQDTGYSESIPKNNNQAIGMFQNDGIKFGNVAAITVVDFKDIAGTINPAPYMRVYSLDTLELRAGEHRIRISDNGVEIDGVMMPELLKQIEQLQAEIKELKETDMVKIE